MTLSYEKIKSECKSKHQHLKITNNDKKKKISEKHKFFNKSIIAVIIAAIICICIVILMAVYGPFMKYVVKNNYATSIPFKAYAIIAFLFMIVFLVCMGLLIYSIQSSPTFEDTDFECVDDKEGIYENKSTWDTFLGLLGFNINSVEKTD